MSDTSSRPAVVIAHSDSTQTTSVMLELVTELLRDKGHPVVVLPETEMPAYVLRPMTREILAPEELPECMSLPAKPNRQQRRAAARAARRKVL